MHGGLWLVSMLLLTPVFSMASSCFLLPLSGVGPLAPQNWDQESADSEEDALGGPNDMSEDDSD